MGKPLFCTGNSLAEESQLCYHPVSQGCADLLLIRLPQLGTLSFLTPENDLGGNKQWNLLC